MATPAATTAPGADTEPPTISEFSLPANSSSITVAVSAFTATDDTDVTGYKLTESAGSPSATSSGWSGQPPSSYIFSSAGHKTLHAWAKDAAGNVSASRSASVTITIPAPPPVDPGTPVLHLRESGSGIDHVVTIESSGLFRLAFEAAYNYGLSQWYDLLNDPSATTNVALNPTDYIPQHRQGALFNQVVNPGDLSGHMIAAKLFQPTLYRSLTILENTPARAIIEVAYHPLIATLNNPDLLFTTRYVIYPTGLVAIRHKMESSINQTITEWRNSIIG